MRTMEQELHPGINMKRVLLGGFVAAFVLNASGLVLGRVLAGELSAVVQQAALPLSEGQLTMLLISGRSLLGFVLVWLHAAMRPRFGVGPVAARWAAVVVWLLAYVPWMALIVLLGWYEPRSLLVFAGWSLLEVAAGSFAGGWFYREDPTLITSQVNQLDFGHSDSELALD